MAVILLILAVSVACLWYAKTHSKKGTIASLVQSGKVIKTINLDEVTESYTFRVDGDDGISYNIIEVRPGEIGVIEASCPDKICISMGFVKEMGLPITCLPNELIIILSDEEGMEPDMVVY